MALNHAESGDLIDVRPLGPALRTTHSRTLVASGHLEVFRLVLPAGTRVPGHKLPRVWELSSIATVHCLEGAVEVDTQGRTQLMRAGHLLYLDGGEAQALKAVEDSSVLVTMLAAPVKR